MILELLQKTEKQILTESDDNLNFTLEDIKNAFPELVSDSYQPGGCLFTLPDGSFISAWKKFQVHDFFIEEIIEKILNIDVYELEETWNIDELPDIFCEHFNIIKVNDGLGPVEQSFYFSLYNKFIPAKQEEAFKKCLEYTINNKLKTEISGYVFGYAKENYKTWIVSNSLISDEIIDDCKTALRKGYFLESVGSITEGIEDWEDEFFETGSPKELLDYLSKKDYCRFIYYPDIEYYVASDYFVHWDLEEIGYKYLGLYGDYWSFLYDTHSEFKSDFSEDDSGKVYVYPNFKIIEFDSTVRGSFADTTLYNYLEKENKTLTIKQYLNESSRTALISKSKGADKYANGKGSRWTQKSKCSVASTVKDYNKIDMNTFWKDDKLTFGVKVTGESGDYVVTISFNNILNKIQKKIHDNKQLLEFKCIYDALIQAINTGDIKVSCTCPDYKYRLKYWNSQNGDEAGEKETRKSDVTNPDDTKGPACKHILAVLNNIEWLNKVASVINNYANYCKENMEYNYSKYIFPKLYGMDYKKAVQMTLDDYDDEGNIKDKLSSDEELINLSNALGKVRGRIKKGSNKNPATKKKEESLQEALNESLLLENFDVADHLNRHYRDHCLVRQWASDVLFKDVKIYYATAEEYKKAAEALVGDSNYDSFFVRIHTTNKGYDTIQYGKVKFLKHDNLLGDVWLVVWWWKEKGKIAKRHIETYMVVTTQFLNRKKRKNHEFKLVNGPLKEKDITSFTDAYDTQEAIKEETQLLKKIKQNPSAVAIEYKEEPKEEKEESEIEETPEEEN